VLKHDSDLVRVRIPVTCCFLSTISVSFRVRMIGMQKRTRNSKQVISVSLSLQVSATPPIAKRLGYNIGSRRYTSDRPSFSARRAAQLDTDTGTSETMLQSIIQIPHYLVHLRPQAHLHFSARPTDTPPLQPRH
jgi:hypothetical protein